MIKPTILKIKQRTSYNVLVKDKYDQCDFLSTLANGLKTYLRSTMTQKRLNKVIMLHCHKDKTDELDLVAVAKVFASANESRISFFGHYE